MLVTPARHQPVTDLLGGGGGGGDDSNRDAPVGDELLELVDVAHGETGDLRTRSGRICVDEGGHPETPGSEPGIVREGMTEIADADDHNGPVLGEPDLSGDLMAQEVDFVADTTGPVRAEV